jgi:hypothetical protein
MTTLDTHGAVDTGAEAAIGSARAYPDATVDGFDVEASSVEAGVLAAMRGLAGNQRAVVVMDERVAETFTAPATTWSG